MSQLLSDHFIWNKPEPFRNLPRAPTTIPQWEALEQQIRTELVKLRDDQTPEIIDDEVEAVDFEWLDRKVHSERFLLVDMDQKNPFGKSKIYPEIEGMLKEWDDEKSLTEETRNKLVKMILAKGATEKALKEPSKHIPKAYAVMYRHDSEEWPELLAESERALESRV